MYGVFCDTSEWNYMLVAGAIRRTGAEGWFCIDDDAHCPVNLTVVASTAPKKIIRVEYPACAMIVSLVVTPDESFTKIGYRCGASVHSDFAEIAVYQGDSQVAIDANTIASESGNFWIIGIMAV